MTAKILCATDGSTQSGSAVAFAAELSKQLRVPVSFITINKASTARTSRTHFWDDRVMQAIDAQINKVLADAADVAKRSGLADGTYVVAEGADIAAAICNYASENGFDHIVVGSAHRGKPARLFLGSVAADVVKLAPCAVTIAR